MPAGAARKDTPFRTFHCSSGGNDAVLKPRIRHAKAQLAARVAANRATEPSAMDAEKHLFAYSVFYLFALFAVLVADRFLPW